MGAAGKFESPDERPGVRENGGVISLFRPLSSLWSSRCGLWNRAEINQSDPLAQAITGSKSLS